MLRSRILALSSHRATAGFVIALLGMLLWPGVANWTGTLFEPGPAPALSSHALPGTAQAQASSPVAGADSKRGAAGSSGNPGDIVLTYGVGGVLTADGTLWQYRPDQDEWLTIDEAFRGEGRTTRVLPLPVAVEEIADMATFGFIITTGGDSYLYDLNANQWKLLPQPKDS